MKKTLGFGVLSVIIGLVLLVFCASDAYSVIFKKQNIEDMTYGTIEKGDVAEAEIKYVVAKIGTLEKSRKLFFIPLGSAENALYLIADNGGYVTIEVREDTDVYDEIAAQTAEYLEERADAPTTSHRFLGIAEEISDEQLELLRKHFEELNVSADNWEFAVSSMVLTEFDLTLTVIELCICFGFVMIGVILMLISRRYRFGETVFVGEKVPGEEGSDEKKSAETSETEDEPEKEDTGEQTE